MDERSKRTGAYIELLGTYNPLTEPKDIKLKQDRIDYWVKQGAQMSTGYLRIIGKAPQRPPRKPKKEKKTEEPSAISDQTSEKKVQEEKPVEEMVGEETKPEAERPEETAKSETDKPQEATEGKSDEDSRLSEGSTRSANGSLNDSQGGEVSSESTSSDVHEPDRTDSEPPAGGEEAELENQDQTNEGASSDERPA